MCLRQAIQGIADVITTIGLVNVDFADVRTIMSHTGRAVMGMGTARGADARDRSGTTRLFAVHCSKKGVSKEHAACC